MEPWSAEAGGAEQPRNSAPSTLSGLEMDACVHVGFMNTFQSSLQVLHFDLQENKSLYVVDWVGTVSTWINTRHRELSIINMLGGW